MKVTIEVDCTPEEARRAIGLPDLTPLHDRFIAQMQEGMDRMTIGPEMIANIVRGWGSAGENGLEMWRRMLSGSEKTPPA